MPENNKPHIAIVVNSITPGGGVNNVALTQALALSEYYSITLFCAHADIEPTRVEGISIVKVTEPALHWMRRLGHSVREYLLCKRFLRAINALDQARKIDFILFHSHTSAAIVAPKLNRSIACGMVIHGDIFTRPKGSYDPLLTALYKRCSLKAYRTIHLVIALSPTMRDRAIQYGARQERVVVVPNGIDTEFMVPKVFDSEINDRSFKLLFVGRFAPEKAPMVMLESLKLTDANVQLAVAGEGILKTQMLTYIEAHDLTSRVTLLGKLDTRAIQNLYETSDALCVPSVNDPLPTVVLEAMWAGLPVIGTNIDGIPFMIEHDANGLLVPANDVVALAEAIGKLAKSADLRLRMSIATQQRLSQHFSLEAVTQKLVGYINSLITSG